jgi:hypothetical protein
MMADVKKGLKFGRRRRGGKPRWDNGTAYTDHELAWL